MRRAWRVGIAIVLVAGVAFVPPAAARRSCRTPKLVGLTVSAAEHRASAAGCELRLHGATLERPEVQTIGRQTPTHGGARRVSVWVNPLCPGSAELPGPRNEPTRTKGVGELITGLYLVGGPLTFRSALDCEALEGTPGAGTIIVIDPATRATVATQVVTAGHLAMIPLPPGAYAITGTFAGATINGQHPTVGPTMVELPPSTIVRQDLYLSIP